MIDPFKIKMGQKCLCKNSNNNSKGHFTGNVIQKLNKNKIKLNITAVYSSVKQEKF